MLLELLECTQETVTMTQQASALDDHVWELTKAVDKEQRPSATAQSRRLVSHKQHLERKEQELLEKDRFRSRYH